MPAPISFAVPKKAEQSNCASTPIGFETPALAQMTSALPAPPVAPPTKSPLWSSSSFTEHTSILHAHKSPHRHPQIPRDRHKHWCTHVTAKLSEFKCARGSSLSISLILSLSRTLCLTNSLYLNVKLNNPSSHYTIPTYDRRYTKNHAVAPPNIRWQALPVCSRTPCRPQATFGFAGWKEIVWHHREREREREAVCVWVKKMCHSVKKHWFNNTPANREGNGMWHGGGGKNSLVAVFESKGEGCCVLFDSVQTWVFAYVGNESLHRLFLSLVNTSCHIHASLQILVTYMSLYTYWCVLLWMRRVTYMRLLIYSRERNDMSRDDVRRRMYVTRPEIYCSFLLWMREKGTICLGHTTRERKNMSRT